MLEDENNELNESMAQTEQIQRGNMRLNFVPPVGKGKHSFNCYS